MILLHYLASNGLDALCRFALLPWTVLLLRQSLGRISDKDDSSWGIVMCAYGFMCSSLNAGRILGKYINKYWTNQSEYNFNNQFYTGGVHYIGILSLAFLGMTLTTRYSVLLVVYFIIGYAGARICIFDSSTNNTYDKFIVSDSNVDNNRVIASAATVDTNGEVATKRTLIVFIITSLASGVLYDKMELTLFPARDPCRLVSFICFIIYILMTSNSIKKKAKNIGKSFNKLTHLGRSNQPYSPSSKYQGYSSSSVRDVVDTNDELYEGVVPVNFLNFHKDEGKARTAYSATLRWRKENSIESLLSLSQLDTFDNILTNYPHFIHGVSRDNCVVVYELLGRAKPSVLNNLGITPEMLVWHFMLRNEYIFQRVIPKYAGSKRSSDALLMTVLDVKNVNILDITANTVSFIKQSAEIMDTHYPGVVARLVICNAPMLFYSAWSMVARVLPDSVKKKISIISDCKGLDDHIDPSQRPAQYDGTDPRALGQAEEHLNFIDLKNSWDNHSNQGIKDRKANNSQVSNDVVDKYTGNTGKAEAPINETVASTERSWFWSKKKAPTVAFLGETNKYHYDNESNTWVLDTDNSTDSNDLEEHGLVLAIQAAHLASLNSKNEKDSSEFSHNLTNLVKPKAANAGDKSTENSLFGGPNNKINANIFILVTLMFILSCLVQTGLVTLLPVWLATDAVQGGLGYSVSDISLTLAGSGCTIALLMNSFRSKLATLVRTSPVRVLRIACGCLVVIGFTLPLVLVDNTLFNSKLYIHQHFNSDALIMAHLSSIKSLRRPSCSLLHLIYPSIFISALIVSSTLSRKAAANIISISLNRSFNNASSIVFAMASLIDIIGPTALALTYSSTYRHHLPYPMDATFFLSLCTCVSSLVFIATLFLNVQLRGDFGVVRDNNLTTTSAGCKCLGDLRSILRSDYNALFGTVSFLGLDQFSYSKSYKSTKDI